MNASTFKLSAGFIGTSYVQQAQSSRNKREKLIKALLSNRRLPKQGWDNVTINLFLHEISSMDSNNFLDNIGVGEREARIFSDIVRNRHFSLGHGIGRSGDITAIQPKAAGSSLIYQLTTHMIKNLIKSDIPKICHALIFPMATGMAIVMSLLTMKQRRPNANYIIWPRIDQKTCLKSMITAGMEVIIIDNIIDAKISKDELRTDINEIKHQISKYGSENILCILSTSSCFAPRAADDLISIGKICQENDIPHMVNNAYGLQSIAICKLLKKCSQSGRLDILIQSTDKNFMVPVGGSIVASSDKSFIDELSVIYPGRANLSPILDLFITLVSMGEMKWNELRFQQLKNFIYCQSLLTQVFAIQIPQLLDECKIEEDENKGWIVERVLFTPNNAISICLTLNSLMQYIIDEENENENSSNLRVRRVTELGSMLFSRCVSGSRIVVPGMGKKIGKYEFENYGGHCLKYHCPYLTIAAVIGMKTNEIHEFVFRFLKCYHKLLKMKQSPNLILFSKIVSESNVMDISLGMKQINIHGCIKNKKKKSGKTAKNAHSL